jgi:RNA polymerase sigma-70 factor (ECF subfamily)
MTNWRRLKMRTMAPVSQATNGALELRQLHSDAQRAGHRPIVGGATAAGRNDLGRCGKKRVMDDTRSDAALISASMHDPRAFDELFRRHVQAVHAFLSRRLGRDAADDLTAETFARAFAGRARTATRDSESFLPFLYGIAANLVRMRRRTEERMLRAYARTGIDPAASAHGSALDTGDLGPALAGALADLRPLERDVLLLVAWGELSYAETGAALGVPVTTVRTALHRARVRLNHALRPEEVSNG